MHLRLQAAGAVLGCVQLRPHVRAGLIPGEGRELRMRRRYITSVTCLAQAFSSTPHTPSTAPLGSPPWT